jgi:hypothetical protein
MFHSPFPAGIPSRIPAGKENCITRSIKEDKKMKNLWEKNEFVQYTTETGQKKVLITGIYGDTIEVTGINEEIHVMTTERTLTKIPPVTIPKEALQKFCRFEGSLEEAVGSGYPEVNVVPDSPYQMTLEDLEAALKKSVAEKDDAGIISWANVLLKTDVYNAAGLKAACTLPSDCFDDGLPNRYSVMEEVLELLHFYSGEDEDEYKPKDMVDILATFHANEARPLKERDYEDLDKKHFVTRWLTSSSWENFAGDAAKKKEYQDYWKQCVEELSARKDYNSFYAKGLACSEGDNPIYAKDEETAIACFKEALKIRPLPELARRIGKIYAGVGTNGMPDWEQAYKYYSIAAIGKDAEASYLLADMFLLGHGVERNNTNAKNLVWEHYYEQMELFNQGKENWFAEYAYEAGQVAVADFPEIEFQEAYRYFLQADTAEKTKVNADKIHHEYFLRMTSSIMESLLPNTNYSHPRNYLQYDCLESFITEALDNDSNLILTMHKDDAIGEEFITLKRQKTEEGIQPKLLVTVPQAQYCAQVDEVTLTVDNLADSDLEEGKEYAFDEADVGEIYLNNAYVGDLWAQLTIHIEKEHMS